MAKKRFNLADYDTRELPKMDALPRKRLEYVPLNQIRPDPKNFYSTDGLEALADNILTVGLIDPPWLRQIAPGDYQVISGHRRRLALQILAERGDFPADGEIPAFIERGEAELPGVEDADRNEAAALFERLRLVLANSDTREKTPGDKTREVRELTELFTALKKLGYRFPGKLREHVAAAAHVSESRVARLAVIDKNLIDVYRLAFDAGKLNEGNAYRLSQESEATQRDVFTRIGPTACDRTANELEAVIAAARNRRAPPQSADADSSPGQGSLTRSSFDAEAYLAERAEEDDAFFEMLSAEADTFINNMGAVNSRQEGIQLLKENLGRYHHGWYNGKFDVTCSPKGVRLWDVNRKRGGEDITRTWTDVYDMLCTIALNRAAINIGAEPEDEDVSRMDTSEPEWMTGDPPRIGRYFCKVDMGDNKPHENRCWWGDDGWSCYGTNLKANGWKVVGWWPLPKEG